MFSLFFIRRPIVACVIAILIVLLGAVAYPTLSVAQYPDITPPVIQVTATYPGASAQVIADTVAAPIEQQVNGVSGMLYMESTSASDGSFTLKVTFEVGTDPDLASVLVQNRVNTALPKLPEAVRQLGVTTDKVSSSIVTVFSLVPKTEEASKQFDDLFLANYLVINMQDAVRRIPGVGNTTVFPSKDYGMRIWLDPDKLRSRGLTTVDIINALREQNVQVAAGVIGQPPVASGQAFQYNVTTLGRLSDVEQFENIIVKADGQKLTRVRDVARVELGGKSYDTLGRSDGLPAGVMVVYQAPGGNAVKVSAALDEILAAQAKLLPEGLEFRMTYNTAKFVVSSIEAVYHTIIEATVLVLIVVLIFLGSVRSTIIPILAIPVSIIGTMFFAKMFGFSVNLPVLFGLVLAIGIVVDDAIVVVENVERVMIEDHLPPRQATAKAMTEVFGAVVAISLVLMAVFLPTAALPGISGQLYRQFALTIAASTLLSAVCALTLSPALCGMILKAHKPGHKPNLFNRSFNKMFEKLSNGYAWLIRQAVRPSLVAFSLLGFAGTMVATVATARFVPTGFLPNEDRGYTITEIWMPDSASQERTLEVIKQVEQILLQVEGIHTVTSLQGFSLINGNGSNYAAIFSGLKDWKERVPLGRDIDTVLRDMNTRTAAIQEGIVFSFSPPAIEGVGNASGFDLRLLDRGGVGRDTMQAIVAEFVTDGNAQTKLSGVNSAYRAGVPQIYADLDRDKVKELGIPLQSVFDTMSGYLGSAYINDFNLFGRTWQVNASAESRFRATVDDIKRLEVRNQNGDMVPLGTLLSVREQLGADRVVRFNLYPAAMVAGSPSAGHSSGEAMAVIESMAAQKLPPGVDYAWTNLSYQEKKAAGQGGIVFIMALVVVYLILAALYESWATPLAVIFSIPLAVLGAMLGLMLRGMDNNIYTSVGLVLLVGLGAKNAILIVEFARANRLAGKSIVESAVESSRMRLRPILMTAFAFILGVVPLVIATGAGAASRQAIGTAVFAGMVGNTFLGLFFTPILYVVIQTIAEKIGGPPKKHDMGPAPAPKPDAAAH